jgi:dihydropteroate synthase
MSTFYPRPPSPTFIQAGRARFSLEAPLVMGIVNVTPDSFSDAGQFQNPAAAIALAQSQFEAGADIIDVGGESTRPGATPIGVAEELRRVLPVLKALLVENIPVSIDTRHTAVMQAALDAGAVMVNDVNALRDEGAIALMQRYDCAICLMHMQGEPSTMQGQVEYWDVVAEVAGFLAERARACLREGIAPERILLDPGFGFGKAPEHNLELMRNLPWLHQLGFPLLLGWSRKSTLGVITSKPVGDRLAASVAAALASVAAGAAMVRVHDVAETVDALKIWAAFKTQPNQVVEN